MNKLNFISPLILQKLIWIPTRLILSVFGHLEIRGLENLKGLNTNVIFACNHSSEMDVFMVPGSLGFFSRFSPIFYTSREQSFYKNAGWRQKFYGGGFFKAWGAYPVQVGLHDYGRSLQKHIEILRSGGNLCFFPEGRTTPDGRIQNAKGGIAHLSYASKKPIVPVYLGGTFRLGMKEFLLGRRKLSVHFGAPIYVAAQAARHPSFDEFKNQAALVMDKIRELSAGHVPVTAEPRPVVVPEPA